MTDSKTSTSVIRNIQIVFVISSALLLISIIASFTSIKRLIENVGWVNHTYEVLLNSERISLSVTEAESNQRGFIITKNGDMFNRYKETHKLTWQYFAVVKKLTTDSKFQYKNIEELRKLLSFRFLIMERVLLQVVDNDQERAQLFYNNKNDILKGKETKDKIDILISSIKKDEEVFLELKQKELSTYTNFTPVLLIITGLMSLIITLISYLRIKKDIDQRMAKQLEDKMLYDETAERINVMERVTMKISQGDYTTRSEDKKLDELGRVSYALNKMAISLENNFTTLENKAWLQMGISKLADAIRGERDINQLTDNILAVITAYLKVPIATFYVNKTGTFSLTSSYSISTAPKQISLGEGLIGQTVKNKTIRVISEIPADFFIASSIGQTNPVSLVSIPFIYENEAIAVMELGFLRTPESIELQLLENSMETLAIAINSTLSYIKLQNLLEESQAQSEELQVQHTELEKVNTVLVFQSQQLQASEEELRVQQEELQQTNEELKERSLLLEERNNDVRKKAEELELSTKYKSEFLANMSHELRTPLNSILLLSRLLSENNDSNLNTDQVEYAKVIESSGNGLLGLIDEILDLSKIEAGKMQLEYLEVSTKEILEDMEALFKQVAKSKQLKFKVTIEEGVPEKIVTDKGRLEQILKNLISNALKFTNKGHVSFEIKRCHGNENLLCFIVKDTGIGIAREKQGLIFEAFQQADGSTKRKFGGTGLGLSISRELTKLLGGDMHLNSIVNEGSEFILRIPLRNNMIISELSPEKFSLSVLKETDQEQIEIRPINNKYIASIIPESIKDDRNSIGANDKVILVIEDDTNFAKSLLKFANKKGYKVVVAVRGDEGLTYAKKYLPVGILLDVQLPVKSGWEVMDELKSDKSTRHIPVHMMSSYQVKNESLLKGAVDFINKPFAHEQMDDVFKKIELVLSDGAKKVLIVEDNPKHAKALAYFLETFNISSEVKSSIKDGIAALKQEDINCVILDMGIPDIKSYQLLEEAKQNPGLEHLPIIIFTGKSLSMPEEQRIKQYADSIVVKTAHSYQRMLDEVSLFLHVVEDKQKPVNTFVDYKKMGMLNEILNDKTVLVVDDDVRNIFSLSKALEAIKMNIITAVNGKEALEKLKENSDIEVVLLDMMMPEMDGYETARQIRIHDKWKKLPIIAVTAKAMTGDREKCIEAGASDYITKPVDVDQLLSLLRVWLYEKN